MQRRLKAQPHAEEAQPKVQPHAEEAQPHSEQHGGTQLLNVTPHQLTGCRLYWPSKWISANTKPCASV